MGRASAQALVETIAMGSAQQTTGIEQIHIGIRQLFGTMQSNAAAAEELSATARPGSMGRRSHFPVRTYTGSSRPCSMA